MLTREEKKQCSSCRALKSLRYYSRDRTRRDGLSHRCRACESERQRDLYFRRRYGGKDSCITRARLHHESYPVSPRRSLPVTA